MSNGRTIISEICPKCGNPTTYYADAEGTYLICPSCIYKWTRGNKEATKDAMKKSKVTNIVMNDLEYHIIEKLDAWLVDYINIRVERDVQSPNISVSLSDGVKIYRTLIDEKHFYDEMKYADLAMYAVGSLSTLIELERKR